MEFSGGNRALLEKLDSPLYLVAPREGRRRERMRIHITDVISHREEEINSRGRRAFKEIARTSAWPIQKIPGPTWRGVKRTHNLRYRFHDRVRQEATAGDREERKKKKKKQRSVRSR